MKRFVKVTAIPTDGFYRLFGIAVGDVLEVIPPPPGESNLIGEWVNTPFGPQLLYYSLFVYPDENP